MATTSNPMKYIITTGGTVSGLGKGITISSIGRLLKSCGLRTTSIKIDPYLNCDAGTMSPFEHGECFVLDDGGETDLDLGNYERFLDVNLTKDHNITTGKVYKAVIDKERRGDYLGKTVQVVPHITNEIMDWIERVAPVPVDASGLPADVCLVEVGGTVGDIESQVFLEAIRQFQLKVGRDNICFVHVSLVPFLGEQKTKPTQHGVKELMSVGLTPDLIVCRSAGPLEEAVKCKIGLFCHVAPEQVLSVHDVANVYHVPLMLRDQGIVKVLHRILKFPRVGAEGAGGVACSLEPDLEAWGAMARSIDQYKTTVKIALVGKYTGLQDSYLSVLKALKHAACEVGTDLEIVWVESSALEKGGGEAGDVPSNGAKKGAAGGESEDSAEGGDAAAAAKARHDEAWGKLKGVDGIVVPGGFGSRGVEGMVACAKHARESHVPYLGVCLGMQMLVVEYARSVLGQPGAHSVEFDAATPTPAVVYMPEISKDVMGGTMRLGARPTVLHAPANGPKELPTLAALLYGSAAGGWGDSDPADGPLPAGASVSERHRHRYEVNPALVPALEKGGLNLVGRDETGERMEIAELPRTVHPFYIGAQYHPEFKSRPLNPSPLFHGLLLAASGKIDAWVDTQMAKSPAAGGNAKKRKVVS